VSPSRRLLLSPRAAAGLDLYPARSDLAPGLRMAVHGRYLVLYRDLPEENIVRVERVLHSARNLPRDVKLGQTLLAGEPVGVMPGWEPGTTTRWPALYVELRRDGAPINPAPWLTSSG
jgi:hypothetical protein